MNMYIWEEKKFFDLDENDNRHEVGAHSPFITLTLLCRFNNSYCSESGYWELQAIPQPIRNLSPDEPQNL